MFLLENFNKNMFFLHEMDKLTAVLMSIEWWNKERQPLHHYLLAQLLNFHQNLPNVTLKADINRHCNRSALLSWTISSKQRMHQKIIIKVQKVDAFWVLWLKQFLLLLAKIKEMSAIFLRTLIFGTELSIFS